MEPRVPTWIYLCNARHRCNLYKKSEVCYRCTELGHRADMCARTLIKCRGCTIPDPPCDHVCLLTRRLCGKQHITGDSRFKEGNLQDPVYYKAAPMGDPPAGGRLQAPRSSDLMAGHSQTLQSAGP
ncbi:hypothetical protein HPB50_012523 [Hyalomma asiaticum]|uniref:Uncharacterized protein n=1 Tax=Hyalomma asiaticum TaxID=266040 RepID=A0ACB7RPJ9_HYAAI|nr:hypothetical protein HPB50_012523 [Hyalomma asiaticum]